jgi:hypothetical protein
VSGATISRWENASSKGRMVPTLVDLVLDYMQAQHKILIDKVVYMQGEQNEREELMSEVNMLNSDNNYLKSQLDLF